MFLVYIIYSFFLICVIPFPDLFDTECYYAQNITVPKWKTEDTHIHVLLKIDTLTRGNCFLLKGKDKTKARL